MDQCARWLMPGPDTFGISGFGLFWSTSRQVGTFFSVPMPRQNTNLRISLQAIKIHQTNDRWQSCKYILYVLLDSTASFIVNTFFIYLGLSDSGRLAPLFSSFPTSCPVLLILRTLYDLPVVCVGTPRRFHLLRLWPVWDRPKKHFEQRPAHKLPTCLQLGHGNKQRRSWWRMWREHCSNLAIAVVLFWYAQLYSLFVHPCLTGISTTNRKKTVCDTPTTHSVLTCCFVPSYFRDDDISWPSKAIGLCARRLCRKSWCP